MKSRQTGFTLVEIAIVLVIIGLLLGGVLKGQELIFNSKVKATFNLTREISAAVNSYLDRYGQLPGDDNQAATRFPSAVPLPVNGPSNGTIPFTNCTAGTATGVACEALYDMRLAGFISGTGLYSVKTPFGGWADLGLGSNFAGATFGSAPALGFYATGMSYKAASAIDTSFDDSNPATGSWRCNTLATYNMSIPDQNVPSYCAMQL
jgi:prepilin-type N-terminal cleavage/methylation domain-containing protein